MANPTHRLFVEDRAEKFLLGLDAKQYKQLAARIFLLVVRPDRFAGLLASGATHGFNVDSPLAHDPRPQDTRPLKGHSGLWAIDQGEFRIVYAIVDTERLIVIRRVGKRNDDEVYRGL